MIDDDEEVTLFFRPDGTAARLAEPASDDLASILGPGLRSRASRIEPTNLPARLAFRLVRHLAGDRGRLADWTRRWPCRWRVDLAPLGGPVLGPFDDRDAALRAERGWIDTHPASLLDRIRVMQISRGTNPP